MTTTTDISKRSHNAAKAALHVLGWQSLTLLEWAMRRLQAGDTISQIIANSDDYFYVPVGDGNFAYALAGSCQYGSGVQIHETGWMVESCGGHGVSWDEETGWGVDERPSFLSWDDIDVPLEDLDESRVARLEAALAAIEAPGAMVPEIRQRGGHRGRRAA